MSFFRSGSEFSVKIMSELDVSSLRELSVEESEELENLFRKRILDSKGGASLNDWDGTWGNQIKNIVKRSSPKYLPKSKFFRFNNNSWVGPIDWMESVHKKIITETLERFFEPQNSHKLIELGCGIGQNLRIAAQTIENPNVEFYGLDWSPQGIKGVKALGRELDSRIKGIVFDMNHSRLDETLFEGATVLTVHALEQMGGRIGVLDSLIKARVKRVITVEPMLSNYYSNPAAERLLEFHLSRGYLVGYEDWLLQNHFKKKSIRILSWGHTPVGTYDSEGYSILCWDVNS